MKKLFIVFFFLFYCFNVSVSTVPINNSFAQDVEIVRGVKIDTNSETNSGLSRYGKWAYQNSIAYNWNEINYNTKQLSVIPYLFLIQNGAFFQINSDSNHNLEISFLVDKLTGQDFEINIIQSSDLLRWETAPLQSYNILDFNSQYFQIQAVLTPPNSYPTFFRLEIQPR